MIRTMVLGFSLALATLGAIEPLSAQLVVIVNAANPEQTLARDDVRAYFLKVEATWANGERVRPIDRAGGDADRQGFVRTVLELSDAELERHWIEQQYASATQPPAKAPDASAVATLVRSFAGAIGFMSTAEWDAADQSGLRVVYRSDG